MRSRHTTLVSRPTAIYSYIAITRHEYSGGAEVVRDVASRIPIEAVSVFRRRIDCWDCNMKDGARGWHALTWLRLTVLIWIDRGHHLIIAQAE
jgi:hypothetical protein